MVLEKKMVLNADRKKIMLPFVSEKKFQCQEKKPRPPRISNGRSLRTTIAPDENVLMPEVLFPFIKSYGSSHKTMISVRW